MSEEPVNPAAWTASPSLGTTDRSRYPYPLPAETTRIETVTPTRCATQSASGARGVRTTTAGVSDPHGWLARGQAVHAGVGSATASPVGAGRSEPRWLGPWRGRRTW